MFKNNLNLVHHYCPWVLHDWLAFNIICVTVCCYFLVVFERLCLNLYFKWLYALKRNRFNLYLIKWPLEQRKRKRETCRRKKSRSDREIYINTLLQNSFFLVTVPIPISWQFVSLIFLHPWKSLTGHTNIFSTNTITSFISYK